MGRMPKMAWYWPGLTQLWSAGRWSGLLIALLFTVLVNLALTSSVVWTDLLSSTVRLVVWSALLVLWAVSFWVTKIGGWGPWAELPIEEDLYADAQSQYLQGNWFGAESLLNRMLERSPRDVDSRLMLATLKRHTGRLNEAVEQLNQLERLDDADRWQNEIETERKILARLQNDDVTEVVTNGSGFNDTLNDDSSKQDAATDDASSDFPEAA